MSMPQDKLQVVNQTQGFPSALTSAPEADECEQQRGVAAPHQATNLSNLDIHE